MIRFTSRREGVKLAGHAMSGNQGPLYISSPEGTTEPYKDFV